MTLFSRLSLTAKVAVVIVGANLAGLAITTWLSWSADYSAGMERAKREWQQATQQIGATAEGAVKWKKAAVVQDAYKTYRGNSDLGLRYFVAMSGKGDVIDAWTAQEGDKPSSEALVKSIIAGNPDKPVVDESLGDRIVVVAPLSLDKKGNRIGYIATSWSPEKVVSNSRLQAGMFAGKQALVLAFVIAAFMLAMRRFVGRPLATLAGRIAGIAEGDLDSAVPLMERGDAVGVIARAVSDSVQSMKDRAEQERVAQQRQREIELERGKFAQQTRDAADRQAATIALLGAALETVAAGDFSSRLGDVDEDFEKLRRDFNTMVSAVAAALSDIADTATVLDGGAIDLAGSADQLARRTESQAAVLEETAAALDEITTTVGQSTNEAVEASRLVAAAKESAKGSSVVVRDAIAAMDRIEESSSQIGKIIGVIDEIAFQTNLLALNAGVEAARAGEAGKGFAVVAQEVRELAQRSASAAKEIKQLVTNSGTEVGAGVTLVDTMGKSLLTIEGQIRDIDRSINSIVSSAQQQSTALSEVNDAIRRMDQNTQQNAAMVEETNAACQELQTQSNHLKAALGNFRFAGSHAATAPHQPNRPIAQPAVAIARSAPKRAMPVSRTATAAVANEWQEF